MSVSWCFEPCQTLEIKSGRTQCHPQLNIYTKLNPSEFTHAHFVVANSYTANVKNKNSDNEKQTSRQTNNNQASTKETKK